MFDLGSGTIFFMAVLSRDCFILLFCNYTHLRDCFVILGTTTNHFVTVPLYC